MCSSAVAASSQRGRSFAAQHFRPRIGAEGEEWADGEPTTRWTATYQTRASTQQEVKRRRQRARHWWVLVPLGGARAKGRLVDFSETRSRPGCGAARLLLEQPISYRSLVWGALQGGREPRTVACGTVRPWPARDRAHRMCDGFLRRPADCEVDVGGASRSDFSGATFRRGAGTAAAVDRAARSGDLPCQLGASVLEHAVPRTLRGAAGRSSIP